MWITDYPQKYRKQSFGTKPGRNCPSQCLSPAAANPNPLLWPWKTNLVSPCLLELNNGDEIEKQAFLYLHDNDNASHILLLANSGVVLQS